MAGSKPATKLKRLLRSNKQPGQNPPAPFGPLTDLVDGERSKRKPKVAPLAACHTARHAKRRSTRNVKNRVIEPPDASDPINPQSLPSICIQRRREELPSPVDDRGADCALKNIKRDRWQIPVQTSRFADTQTLSADRAVLVQKCQSGLGTWIHRNDYGPQIISLSECVVKFGLGVSRQEAETQDYYHRFADESILKLPRVLDFFILQTSDLFNEHGYLVMEYIDGTCVKDLSDEDKLAIAPRVALAMKHLGTIEPPLPSRPGPIPAGGVPCGYFWADIGPCRTFETINDLSTWMNYQLALTAQQKVLNLDPSEFRSRHMDVNSRNVLSTSAGKICFVDWQFAGNYPGIFELLHLKICEREDPVFFSALLKELPDMSAALDTDRFHMVREVMRNNVAYGTLRGTLAPP